MNPTSGGSNPFLQILSQLQGGQSAGLPGGPSGAAGAGGAGSPAIQGGTPGGAPMPPQAGGQLGLPGGGIQGQQQPGSNATKMLIGALQSLHTFALQAVDPQEADLVRQIIVLLSSLIQKDQARTLQQRGMGSGQPGIQPPMPTGASGGVAAQPAGIMGR